MPDLSSAKITLLKQLLGLLSSSIEAEDGLIQALATRLIAANIQIGSGGAWSFGAGTAALPAITLNGDTDTGFYQLAANQFGFAGGSLGTSAAGKTNFHIRAEGLGGTGQDGTGDFFRIDLYQDGVISRPVFQVNRTGGVRVWDHLVVCPLFGTAGGNFEAIFTGISAATAIYSDQGASGYSLYVMAGSLHHDLLRLDDYVSNTASTVTGTPRFVFSDAGLLAFGAKAVGSPALKASGVALEVRLGDNSAYAGLRALSASLVDGIAEPATVAGLAHVYVDVADGDLKVKFGDGFVRTIGLDS